LARAAALHDLAHHLWNDGRQREALSTLRERVAIFDYLAAHDPARYRPLLGQALIDEASFRTPDLAGAQSAGRRAVLIFQELAGVADVAQYGDLSALTPNEHWNGLASAFYQLAHAQWEAGKQTEAVNSLRNRVRVYERLATHDPARYAAPLQSARNDLAAFGG
jgi:hypothetical protein